MFLRVSVSELAKLATIASQQHILSTRKIGGGKKKTPLKKIQKEKKKEGKMKNVWEQNTHHDLYE